MRSRLFSCRVMHHRLQPRRHRFAYRMFMLAVDLDELAEIGARLRLLSVNGRNLFSLREADYLPADEPLHGRGGSRIGALTGMTLKQRVVEVLAAHGIDLAGGRVELITLPRMAGYAFNPVSFYFCRDAGGRPLAALAEVTNTFGEIKLFILPTETWRDGAFRLRARKDFYVSPFSDVDVAFDFVLRPPDARLALGISDMDGAQTTLVTTLTGAARPLTDAALAACALRFPLLTVLVVLRIHWHALLLWLKRVPWFAKAARAAEQRDLWRPHRSLGRTA